MIYLSLLVAVIGLVALESEARSQVRREQPGTAAYYQEREKTAPPEIA
jgi:hypothetical protein